MLTTITKNTIKQELMAEMNIATNIFLQVFAPYIRSSTINVSVKNTGRSIIGYNLGLTQSSWLKSLYGTDIYYSVDATFTLSDLSQNKPNSVTPDLYDLGIDYQDQIKAIDSLKIHHATSPTFIILENGIKVTVPFRFFLREINLNGDMEIIN